MIHTKISKEKNIFWMVQQKTEIYSYRIEMICSTDILLKVVKHKSIELDVERGLIPYLII